MKTSLWLGLISLLSLALAGCESEMKTLASSGDSGSIISAVVTIFGTIFIVLLLLVDNYGFGQSLAFGGRYTGFIILLMAPFQFAAGHTAMGIALLVVAVVGIMLPLLMKWTMPRKPKVIVKKEAAAEEEEERIARTEERLDHQEARLNQQEREIEGKKTAFRG